MAAEAMKRAGCAAASECWRSFSIVALRRKCFDIRVILRRIGGYPSIFKTETRSTMERRAHDMPADITTVRKFALMLPGVTESLCHGTPAFYAGRKLMIRLREDGESLAIAYPRNGRDALIAQNPDVFSVTDHYRNYDYVLLDLPAANERLLGEMIEGAWRQRASKKQVAAYDTRLGHQ